MATEKKPWTCGGCALVAVWFITALLIATAGIGYLSYQASQQRSQAMLNKQIEEIAEGGLPVDHRSLDAWSRSQSSSEDTQAWIAILNEVSSADFQQLTNGIEVFDPKSIGTGRTATGWTGEAKSREFLAATLQLRNQVRALAAKRRSVYLPIDFDSIFKSFTVSQAVRNVARLYSVKFDVAMKDGDSNAIRQSIETQLELSVVGGSQPDIVPGLIRSAIHHIAIGNLKEAIEADCLSEADLEQLLKTLNEMPVAFDSLRSYFQGHRAMMVPVFQDLHRYKEIDVPSSRFFSQATQRDTLNFLRYMKEFESIDTTTYDSALESALALEQRIKNDSVASGILGTPDRLVTMQVLPAARAITFAFVRNAVERDFIRMGIAIRLYQRKHGELPESLGQLEEFGIDSSKPIPVGGKPFGYRRESDSAILWGPVLAPGTSTATATSDSPPSIIEGMDESQIEYIRSALLEFRAKKP